MVNGNSLDIDTEDVTMTDRGAHMENGQGLYLALPEISRYGFVFPPTFTIHFWVYQIGQNPYTLFKKGSFLEITTEPSISQIKAYYNGQHASTVPNSPAGNIYLDHWGLIALSHLTDGTTQTVKLRYNSVEGTSITFASAFSDTSSQQFLVGSAQVSAPFRGMIFIISIYKEIIPHNDYTHNIVLFYGSGCVYPNSIASDCVSPETDPLKNRQGIACTSCSTSCDDSLMCLNCAPSCNNFCSMPNDMGGCIDLSAICAPDTYDWVNLRCNFPASCISNCIACPNSTQCSACDSGYDLQPDLSCSIGCPSGFTSVGQICTPCHADCSDCSGTTSSDCTGCTDSNSSVSTNPGSCSCNTGFYPSNPDPLVCSSCHSSCRTCSGPSENECSSCTDSLKDASSGTCVCTAGYFPDSVSCTQCHSDCTTCNGPLNSTCLTCSDPLKSESGGQCVCLSGYFPDSGSCTQCHSDCATCNGSLSSNCSTCSDPLKSESGGQCICLSGYFPDSGTCTQCHSDCATCNGPLSSDCLTCSDPLKSESGGQCVCLSGYFPDSGTCAKCHFDCATCNGPLSSDCLTCSDPLKSENGGQCVCLSGYFPDSGSCTQCHSDCATCNGPLNSDCLTCSDPLKSESSGQCVCLSGYFPDSGSCTQCHSDCATCNGPSSSNCSTCSDLLMSFNSGQCACPTSYFSSSGICLQCHSDCVSCNGTQPQDCISCADPLKIVESGACVCDDGYYLQNNECSSCSVECKTCNGPLSTQCTSCVDSLSLTEGGMCICNSGYYLDSQSSLLCLPCHEDCKICTGSEKTDCNSCGENSINTGSACECLEGYYWSSSNKCERCDSICKSCSASSSNCSECTDPESSPENGCECDEGYYFEGVCKACSSGCKTCTNATECQECLDFQAELKNGECKCQEGYCKDDGICVDCKGIPLETERTTEGNIGMVTLAAGIIISVCSMLTLDDPVVLWTVANTAQFLCYLMILDLPVSEAFYQFLISYQTVLFFPNVFLFMDDNSYPPIEYQRFGSPKDEYSDINFIKNTGRYTELICIVLVIYLGLHLLSFIMPTSLKERTRELTSCWVSSLLKIFLAVFLDLCVAASVVLFDDSKEAQELPGQCAMIVSTLLLSMPLILWVFNTQRERIQNKDKSITKYIGSVYEGMDLESPYGFFFEMLLVIRKLVYSATLYIFRKEPLVVLTSQLCFSIFFLFYIILGEIYKDRKNTVINSSSELVLSFTLIGLGILHFYEGSSYIEYILMGINVFFILIASISNILVECIRCVCKKNKNPGKNTPVVEINSFDRNEQVFAIQQGNFCYPNTGENRFDLMKRLENDNFLSSRNRPFDSTALGAQELMISRKKMSDNVICIQDAD